MREPIITKPDQELPHLSEDTIKRVCLRFLKAYYKFRPRADGETIARFDVEANDGIIADGHLTFKLENGEPFVATFEATSFETSDEVIFKTQQRILNWDSLAMAGLFTAFLFSYGFAYNHFTVHQWGWYGVVSLLFMVFGSVLILYQIFFRNINRYRYIYAVEQFKRYHADEQWIAIADDVFDQRSERYLKVLKDQCVFNGFGLISVDSDLQAHMLITPSRQEVFGEKRESLAFYDRNVASSRQARERIKNASKKIWYKLGGIKVNNSLLRYRKSYYNQLALLLFSLLIIIGIFYKESENTQVVYLDEKAFEQAMAKRMNESVAEDEQYLLDTSKVVPFQEKVIPYLDGEINKGNDEADFDDALSEEFEIVELDVLELDAQPDSPKEIYVTSETGEHISYDCTRFNFRGKAFLVQEGVYANFKKAQQQINFLATKGIETNALWLGCFPDYGQNYMVYYDLMMDNAEEAQSVARAFYNLLETNKITSDIKIRILTK